MTTPNALLTSSEPTVQTSMHSARAYCGSAHQRTWSLAEGDPPRFMDLSVPPGVERYRLVCNPRTGRPARDHQGNYLYIPCSRPTE